MKNSYITVTDQFCGAGGSSQGVRNYGSKIGGGIEVKMALNHWKLAIETHNTNFPETQHDCTDISACDPRRYPSTNILITSPECTNHTVANGKKQLKNQMDMFNSGKVDAAADRSRATMWDVVRFAEVHKYEIIITENVVDARKWIMFDAWIYAMRALGYEHKACFLNSMHFWPTPQSRDRMYVVFWKKGNKAPDLNYMPLAHCPKCEKNINAVQSWKLNQKSWKFRGGYVYCCPVCTMIVEPFYYAAFNCIDWSLPGTRIGDRKTPLKENTERRVKKGLTLHSQNPFLMLAAYGETARGTVRAISDPLYTQTTLDTQGIVQSFLVNNQQSDNNDNRIRLANQALSACSTNANFGLVHPMPLIIKGEHTSQPGYIKTANEALQTQATWQSMGIVTQAPSIIELNSTGKLKPMTEAFSTFTAGGVNQGILSSEAFNSFLTYHYGGSDQVNHISKALCSVTTKDRAAISYFKEPNYEDCYYRTLRAHEVKLGMAFDKDYIILGDSKAQVKQCGNAVTPPPMAWLIEQTAATLN